MTTLGSCFHPCISAAMQDNLVLVEIQEGNGRLWKSSLSTIHNVISLSANNHNNNNNTKICKAHKVSAWLNLRRRQSSEEDGGSEVRQLFK